MKFKNGAHRKKIVLSTISTDYEPIDVLLDRLLKLGYHWGSSRPKIKTLQGMKCGMALYLSHMPEVQRIKKSKTKHSGTQFFYRLNPS